MKDWLPEDDLAHFVIAAAARVSMSAFKISDLNSSKPGTRPVPPDDTPRPDRHVNLTDPGSALMRRSDAHEYRQAYNAQAVVCADGAQLVLATNLVTTSADAQSFAQTILAMHNTVGLPPRVLADSGYASGPDPKSPRRRALRRHPKNPAAPPLRLPPAAAAKDTETDHRTLAQRHEGQARD